MSSDPTPPSNPNEPHSIPFSTSHMSARVPEKVARGVIATGFLAYFGQNEFVIDFLQQLARPTHLAARVIMHPNVAEQFLTVLRDNYSRFSAQFGAATPIPKPPAGEPPPRSAQEIYDDLKISDDLLSGVYANNVLVGHTPAEFGIDFITSFIPHAAVSARVYLAAPRLPQLMDTLGSLLVQYKRQFPSSAPPSATPPPPPQNFGTAPGVPGFPTPPSPEPQ